MGTTRQHSYQVAVKWTGNQGEGTSGYDAYERAHEINCGGKPPIPGSSDPVFRGDARRYNPEELLVAALSTCHMLWFLHLSAISGIVVIDYHDRASGTMNETADGGGHFTEVVLAPEVIIASGDVERAQHLHERAHHLCFIANSVNFPVRCRPTVTLRAATV